MKKKGLIIATIVMVLVLAVSLTTATYAWFTVASVTTIDGFEVSVVPGTDVKIGLKADNTYNANAVLDDFMYGDVTYTPEATPGALGLGDWTNGSVGLGAEINHGIEWGEQSWAVGVTTETDAANATVDNTGLWNVASGKTAIFANGENQSSLTEKDAAVANEHYAYLFLGVAPTKNLKTNQLVILLDSTATTGQNAGILTAVHVAYRLNSAGDWTDVDLCDGVHYDDPKTSLVAGLTELQQNAYVESYSTEGNTVTAPTQGAKLAIDLGTTEGAIDQIEIVIYIAGDDEDCNNLSLNAAGAISIFFATEELPVEGN